STRLETNNPIFVLRGICDGFGRHNPDERTAESRATAGVEPCQARNFTRPASHRIQAHLKRAVVCWTLASSGHLQRRRINQVVKSRFNLPYRDGRVVAAGRAACTEVIPSSRSDQRQALAAAENEETPNSDGSIPFSRCEPDPARRPRWCRRRLRRTGTAPRLRSNSRRLRLLRWRLRLLRWRLRLLRWRLRLLRWRRCRDRPGWCHDLRRRRRWCRN